MRIPSAQSTSLRCILAVLAFGAATSGSALAEETVCFSAQAAEVQALELMRDNFIYPDMWASALVSEEEGEADPGRLASALARIPISHTQHFTPDEIDYYDLLGIYFQDETPSDARRCAAPDAPAYVGIGALFAEIDGATFIRGILPGSPAQAAGLLVGDEVTSADGRPFQSVRSFEDRAGKRVSIAVRRTRGGAVRSYAVTPQVIDPRQVYLEAVRDSAGVRLIDDVPIGYIRMWSYSGDAFHEALVEALSTGALRDARGLILDLRGAWGGASPDHANLFVGGAPVVFASDRDGDSYFAGFRWTRPVVVLTDSSVRSGKELLAYAFRAKGLPLVGSTTAGAVSGAMPYVLGDGTLLTIAVQEVTVDGERLEGVGVSPTHPVEFSLSYSAGQDAQLAAAEQLILEITKSQSK